MQKLRLLLIDHQPIVCRGIKPLLRDADDFRWSGNAFAYAGKAPPSRPAEGEKA